MFWIGRLRGARWELALWAVSAIFEKWHFVIQPRSLLFDTRKSCVFLIFLLRSIKAYLCPNIINFYAVDFSESRPEEVISFFWRSVYFLHPMHIVIWEPEGCNHCTKSGVIAPFWFSMELCWTALKPQDSFDRSVKKNSRSSESGPYHQKAPLNPPAIVLNDML